MSATDSGSDSDRDDDEIILDGKAAPTSRGVRISLDEYREQLARRAVVVKCKRCSAVATAMLTAEDYLGHGPIREVSKPLDDELDFIPAQIERECAECGSPYGHAVFAESAEHKSPGLFERTDFSKVPALGYDPAEDRFDRSDNEDDEDDDAPGTVQLTFDDIRE